MPINKQGYFEEYYPNFEFAQGVSQLNPEQFSGVVYDPVSGRAVFAPPSTYKGPSAEVEQDISPEEILQQQLKIAMRREEEDYENEYMMARNKYAEDDINFIRLMRDAPEYADQFMKQREVAYAVFQKETQNALLNKDMAIMKRKRQEEDIRNQWKIIDMGKNRDMAGDAGVKELKKKVIGMGGLSQQNEKEMQLDEAIQRQAINQAIQPSVQQEADREIQKRQRMLPYLMQEEALRREARGEDFTATEKKDIEELMVDKISLKPDRLRDWIPGLSGTTIAGLQEAFNEMLELLPNWKTMTTAQKKWFLNKFNVIAKVQNPKWKDLTFEAVNEEMTKWEKK